MATKTPTEAPTPEVPTQVYFYPALGISIEATTKEEADKQAEKLIAEQTNG